MIYLLFGENTYLRERELTRLLDGGESERFDGATLERCDIPDIFSGQTLFSDKRTIVIRDLSENSAVWPEIESYVGSVPSDTTLLLVETKTDKRSRTYKVLQKVADIKEFHNFKQPHEAVSFALGEAKVRGVTLDRHLAQYLVTRIGIDSWAIVHALEKLSVLDEVNERVIDDVIDADPTEQVFGLFEAALSANVERVSEMCQTLALNEDPYRVMGLLATQVTQLAVLTVASAGAPVANDLGLKSDYGLSKLQPFARTMSRMRLRCIVESLSDADIQMKSSGERPWYLIEQALQKIATKK